MVELEANLTSDELGSSITGTNSIQVEASQTIAVTTKFLKVENGEEGKIPLIGDIVLWQVNATALKKDAGTQYLKEGSFITVVYTLNENFEYLDVVGADTPVVTDEADGTTTLTWTLPAPTYAEQDAAMDNLLSFEATIKVDVGALAWVSLENNVYVKGDFIGGEEKTSDYIATIIVGDPLGYTAPPVGNVYGSAHFGPADGNGGADLNIVDNNNRPLIYINDAEDISWEVAYTSGTMWSSPEEFESAEIIYDVSEYLEYYEFRVSKGVYHPLSSSGALPLTTREVYDLYVMYEGDSEYIKIIEDVAKDGASSYELNLDTTKRVDKFKILFSYMPRGLYSGFGFSSRPIADIPFEANGTFTISSGSVECLIVGEHLLYGYGTSVVNSAGSYFIDEGTGTKHNSFSNRWCEERYIVLAQGSEATEKVVHESISLVDMADKTKETVFFGANSLKVTLSNDKVSLASLKGPFESYVLLPYGVHYTGSMSEVVIADTDFSGSGCELIKISWNDSTIRPNETIAREIPVEIEDLNVVMELQFSMWTFIENEPLAIVPEVLGIGSETDTVKESDVYDFDQDGDIVEAIFKTKKTYTLVFPNSIYLNAAMKGSSGEIGNLISVQVGQQVRFQMIFGNYTDKIFQKVVIMGALPNTNANTLITGEAMNSGFDVVLIDKLEIPVEWKDKVIVYYSENANPQVSGILDEYTQYPTGVLPLVNPTGATASTWIEESLVTDFSKTKSFRIVLKDNEDWVVGATMALSYTFEVPNDEYLVGQQAWETWVVSANKLQATESVRAGLKIVEEATSGDPGSTPKPKPKPEIDSEPKPELDSQPNITAEPDVEITTSEETILVSIPEEDLEPESDPKTISLAPETGDNSGTIYYILMLMFSLIGLLALSRKRYINIK